MTRRLPSAEERALFEATFQDAKPLKRVVSKRGSKPKPAAKPVAAAARKALSVPRPSGIDGNTARGLRKGEREPDARLDLHGLTQSAAHRALATFLRGAQARGLRLLLVVTGKGKSEPPDEPFEMGSGKRGVLKAMAPRWLAEPDFAPFVADVRPAHRKHGGDGAFYIYLRKTRG
jgi:DNA-nicking Smr family endonuclease